nr:hypothetical protein [Tanacetum cinerariifolium]
MQQFWYTIKKIQDTNSYELLLANKNCTVNAKVFRTILDICLRVEGVDFIDVPDDDTALTFLIHLSYKGLLNMYTDMFVDHMHQPWRTLAVIMNKCFSGKTMFIKYSKNQIPLKKSRCKGSKGKKISDKSQETVDVSEESKPEPEPAKKKTSSKRRVKKKVTLSADDNIVSDDPDAALELAKSISQTKDEEAEAARKVYARIMTEFVPESAKKKSSGRSSKSVVIQDTLSTPKSKPATSKSKLKEDNQLLKDQMKELVVNQGFSISLQSSLLPQGDEQDSEFFDDDNDDVKKDEKDGDANDEGDDHVSDTQDADDEDVKSESDEDEIYKYKIHVRKDKDVDIENAKVNESDKGDEDVTDAAKEDIEKTSKVKDDTMKTKFPPSSSGLSISLETPQIQSPLVQKVPVSVILETTNLPHIPEILTEPLVFTTVSLPQVTLIISSIQQTPTLVPKQPIKMDAPTISIAVPKSNALTSVKLRLAKLEKRCPSSTKDTPKGKALTKGSKAGKSASAKKPTEEPIVEVVMDDVGDDVAHDDNQPQDTLEPKTRKTLNLDWLKRPLRPLTPDLD